MDLVLEPDIYSPGVNSAGDFVDKVPTFKNGLKCPCSLKTYNTKTLFGEHIKSKMHAKWIEDLNLNKNNLFVENQKLREVVANQQAIIQRMDNDLASKNLTIDTLTRQLNSQTFYSKDLLEFD